MPDDRPVLYFDTETFSPTPIKDGTHRYAEDAEIIVAAWAYDDPLFGEGEIVVEDLTDDRGRGTVAFSAPLLAHLRDPGVLKVIHNSAFDRTLLRHARGIDLPAEQVEDTMVRAMAHGLPGGLDKLSTIFKLGEDAKHDGKDLIRLFCSPAPKSRGGARRTKLDYPQEWQDFLEYAGYDIRSMRALRAKLPSWNFPGKRGNTPGELDIWLLDQRVNERGFKVDLDLADAAIEMCDRVKANEDAYVCEATFGEVQSANQRDALLRHLLKEYGVDLPDMQKGTIERRLEDPNLPEVVKELLRARLATAVASVSKYKALKRSVSADGRLRGTIQYCGAVRTMRDAGRIFQPQNLVRPNGAESKAADGWIEEIKAGIGDMTLRNPGRAAAVALRGCIVAERGKKLLVADLANIEGRVLAWLAGEGWKLQAFADYDAGTGPDMYKVAYGKSFGVHPEQVTSDQRQIGKVMELALGYQGAAGAFGTMMKLYGLSLSDAAIQSVVLAWREANANIRQFWYDLEAAARDATLSPGVTVAAGMVKFNRRGEWLRMLLPNGTTLNYCQPAIVPHPKFENSTSLSYLGVNSYTRRWERIHTYGGKLAENATQKVARDVLKTNSLLIDAEGFEIVLPVHDEVVCEVPDDPYFTTDRLCALLAARPWWADGHLPLAAAGFETYRYRKD